MNALIKKCCPTPRANARPGGEDWTSRSYPTTSEPQTAGEHFAATWLDVAERFISALWRAVTESSAPWNAGTIAAAQLANLQLWPADFPSRETWNVVCVLSVFGARRELPNIGDVLDLARAGNLDLPGGAGDPTAELSAILEIEITAAGFLNFGRELQRLGRKARQSRRLWHRLRGCIDEPTRERRPAMPIIVRQVKRGKAVRA
jgi:hypothetical protein